MNDKSSIQSCIHKEVNGIVELISSCSEDALNQSQVDKWSVAEQVIHLNKSVSPLNSTMGLPKLTFLLFGKVAFSRTYDEIIGLYSDSLSGGGKASKAYIPVAGKTYDRQRLVNDLRHAYNKYTDHIDSWSESELDTYRLPHPLIGKLTMREMAYFTHYHLQHHLSNMRQLV